ncbi:MAG: COX aromatic rich motif-containing protein, partial [Bradyrhizobium sp.]|nr:COX aromatic rich motif-containing protein [Bradyrhizobium sp.]
FFIPQLGGMIYTMNGMVTQLNLRGDHVGTYKGLASQFSGDGFPDMMFDTNVVSQVDFSNWAANAAKSDQVLDEASYEQLAAQSVETTPKTYRLADPELFGKIASQHIPPAPGPQLSENKSRPERGASHAH